MTALAHPPVRRKGDAALLLSRVDEIADVIAAGTAHATAHSELAPEVVDALAGAGLFSMLTPARFGGLGVDVSTASQVIAAVARHCGSAAWVVMIVNGSNSYVGRFGEAAQQATFGSDAGARFAQVLAPGAVIEPVAGGYEVTGRWGFASGVLHDHWAMIGNAERLVIVPTSSVEIERTWDTIGMRGSGSHTIVTDRLFVPEEMTAPFASVMGNEQCTDAAAPVHTRYAPLPASAVLVGSVLVGLGEAACAAVAAQARTKYVVMSKRPTQVESETFRHALGEARLRVETARLHVAETARAVDEAAEAAVLPAPADLSRLAANVAHAARMVTTAMDDLMYLGGASAFAHSSALGRIWRDANTGARHGVLNPYVNYEAAGSGLVDVEAAPLSRG
ncbi:acyl-CoA dehydrogenase family protein [Nocardioides sp. QY071]|uniref:acyl-CoA dehydrogenase family protein n=1 Tax=Nocardioides sp. QY071 TaxID=3044187 RepID=UPI00249CACB7|nr:acyl-CoA dehydrogenase family protein [Nocardioides sp. QY071]WGY00386.1 acyl-CoA dehydrogenase family protein [Nocardioides sp. QY071]